MDEGIRTDVEGVVSCVSADAGGRHFAVTVPRHDAEGKREVDGTEPGGATCHGHGVGLGRAMPKKSFPSEPSPAALAAATR